MHFEDGQYLLKSDEKLGRRIETAVCNCSVLRLQKDFKVRQLKCNFLELSERKPFQSNSLGLFPSTSDYNFGCQSSNGW